MEYCQSHPTVTETQRAAVLQQFTLNGLMLQHAPPSLRSDVSIALAAVRQNALAIEHALGGVRDDRELWREAVIRNLYVPQHAPVAIRSDSAFMESVVRVASRAMRHALGGASDDRALWQEAVRRDWRYCDVVRHAPEAIRSDRAFMESVVRVGFTGDASRAGRCA